MVFVQYGFDVENVLFVADEGMGNEVDVLLDGIQNVVLVFFGQRRQVDAHARHVHALAVAQCGFVLYFAVEAAVVFVGDNHFQVAVIYQNVVAHLYILDKVGIGHADAFACGGLFGTSRYLYLVTGLERNGFGSQGSRTYFGTLCIHQYGNPIGDRAYIGYQLFETLAPGMGCIHADDIHARFEQFSDKVNLTTLVGNRCNNLCLLQ